MIDNDPAHADDATINVAVIEAPPKSFEGGVGFSTDTQFRANASYRDVDVDGHALQFSLDARLESDAAERWRRASCAPPDADGWVDTSGIKSSAPTSRTSSRAPPSLGARRTSIDERNQWQFGAAFYRRRAGPERRRVEQVARAVRRRRAHLAARRRPDRADQGLDPRRCRRARAFPARRRAASGACVARFAAWQPIGTDYQLVGRAGGGRRHRARRATASRRRCCSAPAATRRCAATRSKASACRTATRRSRAATTRSAASK